MDAGDIQALRMAVRAALDVHATPRMVEEWDVSHGTPRSVITELAKLGVCGVTIPPEYGGAGREVLAALAVVEEIGRRSHSLAGMYWAHVAYVGLNISAAGTQEQKRRFLPAAAQGRMLFAYGLSEPNVGGDLASVETTADRHGDTLVVNGAKRWTSLADIADYIYALVRTGPSDERRRNLSFVLIPTDAPGVEITPIRTMGDAGVSHCDVRLTDVRVPVENVVGGEARWNDGWSLLTGPALEIEKLGIPAMALGIAGAAVDEAWEYSQQRTQFGQRICAHQAIRHTLADARTKLHACRLVLQHAGELVEKGQPSGVETAMAKLFVADTAKDIVLACQQVMGAYGYAHGFGMQRYVRDVLALPIVGGSSAIQRNNIVNLLKLPRA